VQKQTMQMLLQHTFYGGLSLGTVYQIWLCYCK